LHEREFEDRPGSWYGKDHIVRESQQVRIVVIVPTYNERENVGMLIEELEVRFREIGHDMAILVVDDNSPDGTAEVVGEKMRLYDNVRMISGKKEGLGSAYIRGMKYAIENMDADAVMEMDADFSHKPEDVPRLVSALDEGADFIIGSRYVRGGKIPENWPFLRKMNSKAGNIVARHVAGLRNIADCTAGFRCIRTSVLKRICLEDLNVQGYAFQLALLSEGRFHGATVREVPVEFVDRTRGETKLGISDIVEFVLNACWIRLHNSRTFLKFALVGGTGVFVNLGIFTVLLRLGMNKFLASPIAIEISILSNFLLNNLWTFSGKNRKERVYLKGLKFNVVSLLSLFVSYSLFVVLTLLFPAVPPQVHQAIGIVPGTFVNYFLNVYWTFGGKAA
jgi:dolichol-phosphate mannosyltransferase